MKNLIRLFPILFLIPILTTNTFGQVNERDSLALITLFNTTNGPSWTNSWNLTENVSQWTGISLNSAGDSVVGINLNNNQLNGFIPPDIGNIDKLRTLNLSGNQLVQSLPAEVGDLLNLTILNLSENQLSGDIPQEYGQLFNLTSLSLNDNQISGSLPASLYQLINLGSINISNNQLTDSIPDGISDLTNLKNLNLSNNQLNGDIPLEIGVMQTLNTIILNDNQISGKIPSPLNLPNLLILNLSNNNLSGGLANIFEELESISILDLSNNQISDSLDASIGSLTTLTELDLTNNTFLGRLPKELGSLTNLNFLLLANNNFKDSVPESTLNLSQLIDLDISGNQLSHLPDLTSLAQLTALRAQNNSFTFEDLEPNINLFSSSEDYAPQADVDEEINIPVPIGGNIILTSTVGGSANLYRWFKDQIPITQFNADNTLEIQDFNQSDAGTYTAQIINTKVPALTLIRNPINVSQSVSETDSLILITFFEARGGENWLVPWDTSDVVSQWQGVNLSEGRVVGINLSNNQLKGELPAELGDLTNLTDLRISLNQISGEIPESFSKLKNLEIFTIANNELINIPPSGLTELEKLTILHLNGNSLTGLPVFQGLNELWVFDNSLTFNDLEPNLNAAVDFRFSPQDKPPAKQDTIRQGESILLEASIELQVSENQFLWIKNDSDTVSVNPSLMIEDADFRDVGTYRLFVTRESLANLVLEFDFNIEVFPEKPIVAIPPPYCLGDTVVTLSAQDPAVENTIWYLDRALRQAIDTGKVIRYSTQLDRDTLYATNIINTLLSEPTEIPLIIRPTITEKDDTLIASDGGVFYKWFLNGEPVPDSNRPMILRTEDEGLYQVTLVTADGCSATSSRVGIITATLQEQKPFKVHLFPNPATKYLKLKFNGLRSQSKFFEYTILSMDGKNIAHNKIQKSSQINVENLNAGMYFLRISVDGNRRIHRFIKK